MKISVIVVTARLGGLDVLCNSLAAQEGIAPDDWELLLVDDWQQERQGILEDRGVKNYQHLRPRENNYLDPCYANNLALLQARGELVVFFCDMEWAYPSFLADHWFIYKNCPGYTFSGFLDRYDMPELKENIGVDNASWSLFKEEFTQEKAAIHFAPDRAPAYQERKGGARGQSLFVGCFEMPGDFVYFNVDSLPLAVLKDLNGLDERYDGGYGICDIDLGWRANRIGWKFLAKENGETCKKLGMRAALVNLPRKPKAELRSVEANRAIFHEKQARISTGIETVTVPRHFGAWR